MTEKNQYRQGSIIQSNELFLSHFENLIFILSTTIA